MADALPFRTSLHRPSEPAVRPAWERLLAQSDQASAFSHLAFGSAVESALGLPVWLAAVWEDETLRAGALVFEKRRGPFRAAALPPLVPYVTPLLDTPLRETDVHYRRSSLDALLVLIGGAFHQSSLVLHPSLGDARALQWAGWDVRPAYTYRLALHDRASATAGLHAEAYVQNASGTLHGPRRVRGRRRRGGTRSGLARPTGPRIGPHRQHGERARRSPTRASSVCSSLAAKPPRRRGSSCSRMAGPRTTG